MDYNYFNDESISVYLFFIVPGRDLIDLVVCDAATDGSCCHVCGATGGIFECGSFPTSFNLIVMTRSSLLVHC